MDPKKVEIKNLGGGLVEENEENAKKKDMTKELENLNKITTTERQPITIKEHDIQLLKNELDITYDEAKNKLIKSLGDVNKALETYLNQFNLE